MNDVDNALNFVCSKLNALKINYYIVGAVGAYLSIGLKSNRIHDDLDILIEEKDVYLLKDVFLNSDYNFYDNRYTSEKTLNENNYTEGEHEVIAKQKNRDFHIGFFLLSKDEEQYTITEYFKANNLQKKIERTLPIKYFTYQYSNNLIRYKGTHFKTATVECIYKNKLSMNREKDKFDCEIFGKYIDLNKLDHLKGMSKDRLIFIKTIV